MPKIETWKTKTLLNKKKQIDEALLSREGLGVQTFLQVHAQCFPRPEKVSLPPEPSGAVDPWDGFEVGIRVYCWRCEVHRIDSAKAYGSLIT